MTGPDANRRLVTRMLLLCAGMFGFGFTLVPLYDAFCQATGFNGRSGGRVPANLVYAPDAARTVWLELVTTVNTTAPWDFAPAVPRMALHPGVPYNALFRARNPTGEARNVQAIASVAPGRAAAFLHKTECFCFTQQAFEPHQARDLPVSFVLDPGLPADVHTLSLAYSLFDVGGKG